MPGLLPVVSYTITGVPTAICGYSQSASALLIRAQPWLAGYAGTLAAPWIAQPLAKCSRNPALEHWRAP
jgi:hypothetical protein